MSTLLHMSDPHFGTERPAAVEALLRLAEQQQPDLVVLSGDITQRARRRQFAAARRFVEQLDRPLLAIPGNHDIPLFNLLVRWLAPFSGYRRCFGDDLEPIVDRDDLLVIGVNTARPERHEDGEVDTRQVDRVAIRLAKATPGQLRIVVTHQPIHVTEGADRKNLLIGGEHAARRWATAGADLILGGHIHLPFVRPLRERYADLDRDVWVVQAGTALSERVREGGNNSVFLIRHDASTRCQVEQWDHRLGAACFERVATTPLLLDRPSPPARAA